MNKKLVKSVLGVLVSLSLIAATTTTEAYQCRWVHSYYHHGIYYPARKVCTGNYYHHHRHCYWHNGHQICQY
jgi:hypothetical protein